VSSPAAIEPRAVGRSVCTHQVPRYVTRKLSGWLLVSGASTPCRPRLGDRSPGDGIARTGERGPVRRYCYERDASTIRDTKAEAGVAPHSGLNRSAIRRPDRRRFSGLDREITKLRRRRSRRLTMAARDYRQGAPHPLSVGKWHTQCCRRRPHRRRRWGWIRSQHDRAGITATRPSEGDRPPTIARCEADCRVRAVNPMQRPRLFTGGRTMASAGRALRT